MSDISVVDLRGTPKKTSSVRHKTMRTVDGKYVRVVSLDANSETFVDDLTTVFKINVRKAREENKKRLGSADGSARKPKSKRK